jgi:ribonuclease P/MRP protein subunit RPP40
VVPELQIAGSAPSIPQQVLDTGDRKELEMRAVDLYEWLALIRLESPRVSAEDKVDSYISRYQVPEDDAAKPHICKMTWQGLLNAEWLRQTLMTLLSSCPANAWFCLSATEFSRSVAKTSDEIVMLQPAGPTSEYLLMEIKTPQ